MKLLLNYTDRFGNLTSMDGETRAQHRLLPPPVGLALNVPKDVTGLLLFALGRALEAHYAFQDVGIKETTLDSQKGIEVVGGDGPVSRLYGFCTAMRPFTLNNDQLYFPKLVKSVQQLNGKALKDWGRSLRARWENAAFGSALRLQVDGITIDSKTIVNSYFNDRTFHTKPEKNDVVRFDAVSSALGGERQAASFVFWILRDHLLLVFNLLHNVADMSSGFKAAVEEQLTD